MTGEPGFTASLTVEDLERDPYPIYARLRREQPVAYVPAVDLWLVTRAADVETVAAQPQRFTAQVVDSVLDRSMGGPTILTVDGDRHLDLRRSLDSKYRPRVVDSYVDDLVTPIATRLVDDLLSRGDATADLMADYFEPVSVLSLGAVLGLGDVSADTLRAWFHGLADGATNFERDPAKQARSDAVAADIDAVVIPLLRRLLAQPDDSTVSHMLHTGRPPGQPRDPVEVLPSLKIILLGGMQEPGHGAGSTLWALLDDPGHVAAVRAGDVGLDAVVHEGLRWMAPIGTQTRQAVGDTELGGAVIPAGAAVAAVVASACHDETLFDAPEVFDPRRPYRAHAAFGFGPHFCAGHQFSRAQMRIAIGTLLDAMPALRLDRERPARFNGWEFRAPTSLWVRW